MINSSRRVSQVDYVRRSKVVPNHTSTHLLNFALKVSHNGDIFKHIFVFAGEACSLCAHFYEPTLNALTSERECV